MHRLEAKWIRVLAVCTFSAYFAMFQPLSAGGRLDTIDITGFVPSPIPGQIVARVIGIEWDDRCIPAPFHMNTVLDPIPNPLGTDFLSVADAQNTINDAFQDWNGVETSFVAMDFLPDGSTNPLPPGFDFVNEQSFLVPAGSGFIAAAPSTTLILDSFLTDGTDIDGDGDSDVSNTIETCADTDGDGDIEFPEGFYEAGTILDSDVMYNSEVFRFTVSRNAIDNNGLSVDLKAIALHETGHSVGLSHVLNNQKRLDGPGNRTNGEAATMFPFIDTTDRRSELSQGTLDSDDIAWVSFIYPEGSERRGPGALQPGDVDFESVYALIQGEVTHGGQNLPMAGASLSAVSDQDTLESTGFSGSTRVSYDPATGGLFLVSPAFNIANGDYTIPVRRGDYYIGVEAVDGDPVPAGSVSLTTVIGSIFGQQDFTEEFYNGNQEAALEVAPGDSVGLAVNQGDVLTGIDLTTNVVDLIANFGSLDFVGFTSSAPLSYYAVAFPADQIGALDQSAGIALQAGLFYTQPPDASVVPAFEKAVFTGCTVNGDGTATVDLASPLEEQAPFFGQDQDFAPFYFDDPVALGNIVLQEIDNGASHFCLVLQLPAAFPGGSQLPPFIGLDGVPGDVNDVPLFGLSFFSTDGIVFDEVSNFNFMFSLEATPLPIP